MIRALYALTILDLVAFLTISIVIRVSHPDMTDTRILIEYWWAIIPFVALAWILTIALNRLDRP